VKARDDLAVLRFPGPAALVELGFLGHDADRAVLVNPARRHAICAAIAEVLLAQLAAGAGRPARASRTRRRSSRRSRAG
jgi:N-acetylmuramoyl-L-alanine amidase